MASHSVAKAPRLFRVPSPAWRGRDGGGEAAAASSLGAAAATRMPHPLRVGTYNLRNTTDRYPERRGLLMDTAAGAIVHGHVDVLGLQEVAFRDDAPHDQVTAIAHAVARAVAAGPRVDNVVTSAAAATAASAVAAAASEPPPKHAGTPARIHEPIAPGAAFSASFPRAARAAPATVVGGASVPPAQRPAAVKADSAGAGAGSTGSASHADVDTDGGGGVDGATGRDGGDSSDDCVALHAFHCATANRFDPPHPTFHIDGNAMLVASGDAVGRRARFRSPHGVTVLRHEHLRISAVRSAHRVLLRVTDWDLGPGNASAPPSEDAGSPGASAAGASDAARAHLAHDGGRESAADADVRGHTLWVANTHLHHTIDEAGIALRREQTATLLEWMAAAESDADSSVILGDFNAPPHEEAYGLFLGAGYASAHTEVAGAEPAYTFPTGLLAPETMDTDPAATTDYVFFKSHDHYAKRTGVALRASLVAVIGAQHHPDDATLWPSDHVGICAELTLVCGGFNAAR